jgi:PhnB protein
MQLNTYLNFNGNCEAAFRFYEKSFGGKIEAMMTHEGTPMASHVAPEWRNKIIHARMKVGDVVLMGSDAPTEHFQQPQGFSVNLSVKSPEEAERIFGELAENGKIQMPLQPTFWAKRFGMVVDRFGTPWMINCERAT